MGQYSEEAFVDVGGEATGSQGRSQQPLMARDGTFHLPSLSIAAPAVRSFHFSAVLGGGPTSAGATFVQDDDRRLHSQHFTAKTMIVFGIVTGVAQQPMPTYLAACLADRRNEVGRVLTGSATDGGTSQQMRGRMTNDRQLGPPITQKPLVSGTKHVVPRNMPGFQSRRIHGRFRSPIDQAPAFGLREHRS